MQDVVLSSIGKKYPGAKGWALRGIDLSVAAGERFAIVGPSGSGKTTLLRLLAGLEVPTEGEILIAGRTMRGVSPRARGVGLVFQEPALYPHLDVARNLEFGMAAQGVDRSARSARVLDLAERLGLAGLLDRRPRSLSGGERRRVALGRALAGSPRVLLLDEPFSGLDLPLRSALRDDLLESQRREGFALILVTHDQVEAMATGTRVAVLREGRVAQVGAPEGLHERPADRFVAGFLGDPPMALLPILVEEDLLRLEGSDFTFPTHPELVAIVERRGSLWLGVRPGAVVLDVERPARGPAVNLVVDCLRVEARGHESIVRLKIGRHSIAARVPGSGTVPSPGPVSIRLDLSRCLWFSRETDARLVVEG